MKMIHLKALLYVSLTFFSFTSLSSSEKTESAKTNLEKVLEDYIPQEDKRHASFKACLSLLQERKAKIWVETGTARLGACNCSGDGCSTVIFAKAASLLNAKLHSVDIDKEAVKSAEQAVMQYTKFVSFTCSDSILYLKKFSEPIDFLYLDSYDFDSSNPDPSQQHHLKEIIAAYPKLHKNSVVMVDDCDLPFGGKGTLAIKYLLDKGWKIYFEGYQVILTKRP